MTIEISDEEARLLRKGLVKLTIEEALQVLISFDEKVIEAKKQEQSNKNLEPKIVMAKPEE